MTRLLLFTLAGPLMAFGDVAPGERRVGLDRPGRSALLGLLAAALGLRRDDDRHVGLAASLAFAVRIDSAGEAMTDYHTAQTAPARRNRRFATRRDELAIPVGERETILSQRAYRTDAAFTVAVLPLAEEPFAPAAIAAALERPALPLHGGRRACPLGLPPSPQIIDAGSVADAFAAYDRAEDENGDRMRLRAALGVGERQRAETGVEEAFVDAGLVDPASVRHRETRRDDPVSRTRWQFATRTELVVVLPGAPS